MAYGRGDRDGARAALAEIADEPIRPQHATLPRRSRIWKPRRGEAVSSGAPCAGGAGCGARPRRLALSARCVVSADADDAASVSSGTPMMSAGA